MLTTFYSLALMSVVSAEDLESLPNLALHKPAFQVSTWGGDEGDAGFAVDGHYSTDFLKDKHKCTHTGGPDPSKRLWWTVDLGRAYLITKIAITNRGDCCEDRLANFDIKVGRTFSASNYNSREYGSCAINHPAFGRGETIIIICIRSHVGRYVSIEKNYRNSADYLTLCEVKVYGIPAYTCLLEKCHRCDEDAEQCMPGHCVREYAFNKSAKACTACMVKDCRKCDVDLFSCAPGNCRDGFGVRDSGRSCMACTALNCRRCDEDLSKCSAGNCMDGYGFDRLTKQCSPCKVARCKSCDGDHSTCKPGHCMDMFGTTIGNVLCHACFVTDCRTCDQNMIKCAPGNCFDGFGVSVLEDRCIRKTIKTSIVRGKQLQDVRLRCIKVRHWQLF